MEKKLRFILTGSKTYTPIEVIDNFGEYLSNENTAILTDHLIHENLAVEIMSFFEDENGVLCFNLLNGESLCVKKNNVDQINLFTEEVLIDYLLNNREVVLEKLNELDELKKKNEKDQWQIKTNALIQQVSNNDFRVLKWKEIYKLIKKHI